MHSTLIDTLDTLATRAIGLSAMDGDKQALHARAKDLVTLAQAIVKLTQPGLSEFKWTAAARKMLTKPATTRKGNPSLMVARDGDEVWHTDGHYLVKGEPSKRFEPCDYSDQITIAQIKQIIPSDPGDVVTVIGSTDKYTAVDCVELSNGAVVNRLLLSYVTATVGGDVTLHSNGVLHPISVRRDGETVGLVMPIRVK